MLSDSYLNAVLIFPFYSSTLKNKKTPRGRSLDFNGGAEGNRTPDLLNAIQALSQLSYNSAIGLTIWKQPPNVNKNIKKLKTIYEFVLQFLRKDCEVQKSNHLEHYLPTRKQVYDATKN